MSLFSKFQLDAYNALITSNDREHLQLTRLNIDLEIALAVRDQLMQFPYLYCTQISTLLTRKIEILNVKPSNTNKEITTIKLETIQSEIALLDLYLVNNIVVLDSQIAPFYDALAVCCITHKNAYIFPIYSIDQAA